MKKLLFIVVIFSIFNFQLSTCFAQNDRHSPENKPRHEISDLVGDLSVVQKRKIDNISRDSKERVDALRQQQQSVRDSIHLFMEREGDQSREIFPLFEREARLQVAVNREMYTTKLRIDEVLKPEQRQALRNASRNHNKPAKKPRR